MRRRSWTARTGRGNSDPLEYYTTLLSGYAAKGDKDRIALVKEEMQRGFGIRVVPCKFRQDNRDFYIDHAGNTISDA